MNPREVEGDSWIRICELELGLGIILLKINRSKVSPSKRICIKTKEFTCVMEIFFSSISQTQFTP